MVIKRELINSVSGALMRRWRMEAGVNMTKVAQALGCSCARISAMEDGRVDIELMEFICYIRAIGRDPIEATAQAMKDYKAALLLLS